MSILDRGRARAHQIDGPNYRGNSLMRNSALVGPYNRTMSRALWWSQVGGGRFLMSEVPMYSQIDTLGLRYEYVNFGPGKSPGSPQRVFLFTTYV